MHAASVSRGVGFALSRIKPDSSPPSHDDRFSEQARSLLFILVEVLIRGLEQPRRRVAILRKNGNSIIDPNGRGGRQRLGISFELARDTFRQRFGAGPFGLRDKDSKLIAPDPASNVRTANGLHAGARHTAQDLIPHGVSVSVIRKLETAKVHQEQCEGTLITPGAINLSSQVVIKHAAVLEACEGVSGGVVAQLFELFMLKQDGFAQKL